NFTDETPLTIPDVQIYLRSAKDIDVAEQSYQAVLNWIAKNPIRFQDPAAPEGINKSAVWGKIVTDEEHPGAPAVAVINKDVLSGFLEQAGYDYAAVSKKWAAKEQIVRNSQGKFVHNTKVYGIKANYVKLNMEPDGDPDGFM